jgi:hypothetical protein
MHSGTLSAMNVLLGYGVEPWNMEFYGKATMTRLLLSTRQYVLASAGIICTAIIMLYEATCRSTILVLGLGKICSMFLADRIQMTR